MRKIDARRLQLEEEQAMGDRKGRKRIRRLYRKSNIIADEPITDGSSTEESDTEKSDTEDPAVEPYHYADQGQFFANGGDNALPC
jgi:hypothetical protein